VWLLAAASCEYAREQRLPELFSYARKQFPALSATDFQVPFLLSPSFCGMNFFFW
jgi:hypothetical protein